MARVEKMMTKKSITSQGFSRNGVRPTAENLMKSSQRKMRIQMWFKNARKSLKEIVVVEEEKDKEDSPNSSNRCWVRRMELKVMTMREA